MLGRAKGTVHGLIPAIMWRGPDNDLKPKVLSCFIAGYLALFALMVGIPFSLTWPRQSKWVKVRVQRCAIAVHIERTSMVLLSSVLAVAPVPAFTVLRHDDKLLCRTAAACSVNSVARRAHAGGSSRSLLYVILHH